MNLMVLSLNSLVLSGGLELHSVNNLVSQSLIFLISKLELFGFSEWVAIFGNSSLSGISCLHSEQSVYFLPLISLISALLKHSSSGHLVYLSFILVPIVRI